MSDRHALTPSSRLIWQGILATGLLFTVFGLTETLFIWLPFRLGVAEWEFGTVSAFFDHFPSLGLGLTLIAGAGVALGWRWTVRGVAVLCVATAVFMWAAAVLYLTVLPITLQALRNPVMLTAVKKGIVKTAVQATIYPFGLLWLAGAGWWSTVSSRD